MIYSSQNIVHTKKEGILLLKKVVLGIYHHQKRKQHQGQRNTLSFHIARVCFEKKNHFIPTHNEEPQEYIMSSPLIISFLSVFDVLDK